MAIVRVEQLYPLKEEFLKSALGDIPLGTQVFWVQEEPQNMGAWPHMRLRFGEKLFGQYPFVEISRPACANPATGSANRHKAEQQHILAEAFK